MRRPSPLVFLVLLFVAATARGQAVLREAWKATYDGPGSTHDSAFAVASDAEGNVWVTGVTYKFDGPEATTVHHGPGGDLLWTAATPGFRGESIAVDGDGRAYVAGVFRGTDGRDVVMLVQYDQDGKTLWMASQETVGWMPLLALDGEKAYVATSGRLRATHAGGGEAWTLDRPDFNGRGIAVGRGRIAVTGSLSPTVQGRTILTAEHEANGLLLWEAIHSTVEAGECQASAVGRDALGNVYVLGEEKFFDRPRGLIIIKYDSEGREVWASRLSREAGVGLSATQGLAVDDAGSAFIAGQVILPNWDRDWILARYGADGSLLWERTRSGPAGGADAPRIVLLDSSGRLNVAGVLPEAPPQDLNVNHTIVQYDLDGREIRSFQPWSASGGVPWIAAMAVMPGSGLCVVGGDGHPAQSVDYETAVYTDRAEVRWSASFDGVGHGIEIAREMVVDPAGSVYVAAASCSLEACDYQARFGLLLLKYGPDGQLEWSVRHGDGLPPSEVPQAMAIGLDGDVYVASSGNGPDCGDPHVVRYGPDGSEAWAAHYHGPGGRGAFHSAMAVGSDGLVRVAGYVAGGDDLAAMLVQLDERGGLSWERVRDDGVELWNGLAIAPNGDAYVCGRSGTWASDLVAARYDATGNLVWSATWNGPINGADEASAIAVDDAGNAFVTGSSEIDTGNKDFITILYDADGREVWVAHYQLDAWADDLASAVVLDPAGNAFVGGVSYGFSGTTGTLLAYDRDGVTLWRQLQAGGGSVELGIAGSELFCMTSAVDDGVRKNVILQYSDGTRVASSPPYSGLPGAFAVDPQGRAYACFTESTRMPEEDGDIVLVKLDGLPPPASFIRGDCDGRPETIADITDAVVLLMYYFGGGREPPCLAACDANGNGFVEELTDAIHMLSFTYLGTAPPPAPFPACGRSPLEVPECASPPDCL